MPPSRKLREGRTSPASLSIKTFLVTIRTFLVTVYHLLCQEETEAASPPQAALGAGKISTHYLALVCFHHMAFPFS